MAYLMRRFMHPMIVPSAAPNQTIAFSSLSITWNISFSVSFISISLIRSDTIRLISIDSNIRGRCSVIIDLYIDSTEKGS